MKFAIDCDERVWVPATLTIKIETLTEACDLACIFNTIVREPEGFSGDIVKYTKVSEALDKLIK